MDIFDEGIGYRDTLRAGKVKLHVAIGYQPEGRTRVTN
jgi:hypothetical protein